MRLTIRVDDQRVRVYQINTEQTSSIPPRSQLPSSLERHLAQHRRLLQARAGLFGSRALTEEHLVCGRIPYWRFVKREVGVARGDEREGGVGTEDLPEGFVVDVERFGFERRGGRTGRREFLLSASPSTLETLPLSPRLPRAECRSTHRVDVLYRRRRHARHDAKAARVDDLRLCRNGICRRYPSLVRRRPDRQVIPQVDVGQREGDGTKSRWTKEEQVGQYASSVRLGFGAGILARCAGHAMRVMIVVERISAPLCVREAIYCISLLSEMCSDHRASLPNPRPTIGPTDQHFLIRFYIIFGFIFRQPLRPRVIPTLPITPGGISSCWRVIPLADIRSS